MIGDDMRIRRLAFPLAAFGLVLSSPDLVTARNATTSGDSCAAAAKDAAKATGVPVNVLLALTLTETGRSMNGVLQAWPWALNEGGKGHWFESPDDAMGYLQGAIAVGVTNIDIGCFQLNYRWHSAEFPSLKAMMDPGTNAAYAARLVARHYNSTGDWVAAAAAFHSGTPEVAARYKARFAPIYASLSDPDEGDLIASAPAPGFNAYPLLKRGVAGSGGSIVPLSSNAKPLFGQP